MQLNFEEYMQIDKMDRKSFFLTVNTFDSVTEYIAGRCASAGCDDDAVTQIIVASSEILANIDSYAYENGGDVEILTKCSDCRVTVVFRDNGKPFNLLTANEPDITLPLSERKCGGLGIFIVKKLMDNVSYEYINGQNNLTIEKDF